MADVGGADGEPTGSTLSEERAQEARPEFVLRHPAAQGSSERPVDEAPGQPLGVPERARDPQWVTAGLVLVAAATVVQGYRRLGVVAPGRLYPPPPAFAIVVAAAALGLALPSSRSGRRPIHAVLLVMMVGLMALSIVDALVHRSWSVRLLGGWELATAAVLLATAALVGEWVDSARRSRPTRLRDRGGRRGVDDQAKR